MKQSFLSFFVMMFLAVEVFIFFGAWLIFDTNPYIGGAVAAFLLSLFAYPLVTQMLEVEALQKRVAALEAQLGLTPGQEAAEETATKAVP